MVASLTTRVEADRLDGRTDHVVTVSLALEVILLVVVCGPGARIGRASSCWSTLLLEKVLS